jgi:hypothetical protein
MRLTEEQSRELFRRTGNYLKEICDRCGKPLGEVRWTRRGESGEFCSALCRDGEATIASKRRGGRPMKYRNKNERRDANARYQREFRSRHRHGVRKTPSQLDRNKRLAGAKIASLALPPYPGIAPVLEALR